MSLHLMKIKRAEEKMNWGGLLMKLRKNCGYNLVLSKNK